MISPRRAAAFSLAELLAVLVILGIFASMLLPALARAKTTARSTDCQGNLRQIGFALSMYLAENARFPHWVMAERPGRFFTYWFNQLEPYLGGTWTNAPWICPANRTGPHRMIARTESVWGEIRGSYSYNAWGTDLYSRARPGQVLGLGADYVCSEERLEQPAAVAEASIAAPADMIAISDASVGGGIISMPIIAEHKLRREAKAFLRAKWHTSGDQTLFTDGHVAFLRFDQIYAADRSARRWNSDHQPHPESWHQQ